jgi:hypothetical protein
MIKKTAIEWFSEKLNELYGEDNPWFDIPLSMLEQAKTIEKEQIENAFNYGNNNKWGSENQINNGEDYYNEKYIK